MKSKLSILLLLVAAANPLLAANPCQVECLVPSSGAEAIPANGHHSAVQEHAHHAQPPSGVSVSTSNCGSHAAAALRTPAYFVSAPDRTAQTGVHLAMPVSAWAPQAWAIQAESFGTTQRVTTLLTSLVPLRI
ncbi:MAG: hypothetical protein L0Z53_03240 [Acidobacteriales bacterium]|nr:hypothetical protein [Terriglobales bacterium]